jgi:hypothetical protein
MGTCLRKSPFVFLVPQQASRVAGSRIMPTRDQRRFILEPYLDYLRKKAKGERNPSRLMPRMVSGENSSAGFCVVETEQCRGCERLGSANLKLAWHE